MDQIELEKKKELIKLLFDASKHLLDRTNQKIYQLFFNDDSPYKIFMEVDTSVTSLKSLDIALQDVLNDSSIKKSQRALLITNLYNFIQNIVLEIKLEATQKQENNYSLYEAILKCGHDAFKSYQEVDRFPDMKYGMRFGVFPPSGEYLKCLHDAYLELQVDSEVTGETSG